MSDNTYEEEWELECTDPETGCKLYLSRTVKGRFMMVCPKNTSKAEQRIIFNKKFKDYLQVVQAREK